VTHALATASTVKREIVEVCRRMYDRGLIAGQDGNVSVRLADDRLLVTPAGVSKADLTADDLVEISLAGVALRGSGRPSTEVAVHLRIYARRPDVAAVVHAHPPTATGFAVAGEELPGDVLPELICLVGRAPLVPYAMPGTAALAEQFEPYLEEHDAFLMANHGAVTVGSTLRLAHQRMENLEHAARIILTARQLGRVVQLSAGDVRALEEMRASLRRREP
jgi:L-fuculose-phosphate aldolase